MNYLLKINYDGTQFKGFAKQPRQKTIQGEIENAVEKIYGVKVKTVGSGRTDAGVHALAQFVSFSCDRDLSVLKMKKALNAVLPDEIRVEKAEVVDEFFSARFSAKKKIYEYVLVYEYDAFNFRFAELIPNGFEIKRAKRGAKYLVGQHNFKSFSTTDSDVKDFVKTIYSIKFIETENGINIQVCGSGFLHNMVRIIVGTLLDCGAGKITPKKVKEILQAEDRRFAGKTAPAKALFLKEVLY